MYVTQDIITELIKQIDTAMAAVNVNVHGNGIAVKDTAGQVVTLNVTQNGTRNYVGITDTARTGYYIRTNGIVSETRKAANTKRGSCGIELDVRVPLKLVFWHVCADPRCDRRKANARRARRNHGAVENLLPHQFRRLRLTRGPGAISARPPALHPPARRVQHTMPGRSCRWCRAGPFCGSPGWR